MRAPSPALLICFRVVLVFSFSMHYPQLRRLTAVVLCCLLSASAAAQQVAPPREKISPSEILSRYIAAIGGADSTREVQTLEVHGDINLLPSGGRYHDFEFYFKAPSSDLFKFDSLSHGTILFAHDHGKVWIRSIGVPSILNGIPPSVMATDWIVLSQPYNEQLYKRVEVIGISKVQSRQAYAVRFSYKSGEVQVRYYDCDSFLLLGLDQMVFYRDEINGPERAYKVETDFLKYKQVGSLKFPVLMTFQTSAHTLALEVESIKVNADITDSTFEKR